MNDCKFIFLYCTMVFDLIMHCCMSKNECIVFFVLFFWNTFLILWFISELVAFVLIILCWRIFWNHYEEIEWRKILPEPRPGAQCCTLFAVFLKIKLSVTDSLMCVLWVGNVCFSASIHINTLYCRYSYADTMSWLWLIWLGEPIFHTSVLFLKKHS